MPHPRPIGGRGPGIDAMLATVAKRAARLGPEEARSPVGLPDGDSGNAGGPNIDALADEGWHDDVVIRNADWSGSDAELVTVERAIVAGANVSGCRLDRLRLCDVVFDGCDLSNTVIDSPSFVRVELRDCRVTGLALRQGRIEDLRLTACRGEAFSMTGPDTTRMTIEHCQLHDADFRETPIDQLVARSSDLTNSEWNHARLAASRFTECDLAGVKGASGLRGATIDEVTLLSAAAGLAAALGIGLTADDTPAV